MPAYRVTPASQGQPTCPHGSWGPDPAILVVLLANQFLPGAGPPLALSECPRVPRSPVACSCGAVLLARTALWGPGPCSRNPACLGLRTPARLGHLRMRPCEPRPDGALALPAAGRGRAARQSWASPVTPTTRSQQADNKPALGAPRQTCSTTVFWAKGKRGGACFQPQCGPCSSRKPWPNPARPPAVGLRVQGRSLQSAAECRWPASAPLWHLPRSSAANVTLS